MTFIKISRLTFCVALATLFFRAEVCAQPTDEQISIRFTLIGKRICEEINKGDFVALEGEFSANLQKEMPLDKLRGLLTNLIEGTGAIKQMGTPILKWKNVAVIPLQFNNNTMLDLRLDLDTTTERLAGIYFLPHVDELPVPEKIQPVFGFRLKANGPSCGEAIRKI